MTQHRNNRAREGLARGGRRLAALMVASLCACAPDGLDPAPRGAQPLISENDDRKEVFEHESAWMRSYAEQATVALVDESFIGSDADGLPTLLDGPTLGEFLNLCPGERFAEQRRHAFCSGTLIDDNLVLTSGHCVPDAATCARTHFVFNDHYIAPGVRRPLSYTDIIPCREVVVMQAGDPDLGEPDFAILRTAGRVTGWHQPAPVRRDAGLLDPGQHVKVVGFPYGIPAKIDMEGSVVNNSHRTNYFVSSLDTFVGNAGSGVYESDGYTLAGIHVGRTLLPGENLDYHPVARPGGGTCNTATVCSTPLCGTSVAMYVRPALDALCADPSRSQRLCGTGAPPNDACASATGLFTWLSRQQTFSGFTTAAEHSITPSCGRRMAAAPDVFYRFELTNPLLFYADAFTSDYPAMLFLMKDTCAASAIVACNAGACGTGQGQITRRLEPGTYFLGVSGNGGTRGRYNVHMQFLPATDTAVAIPSSGTRTVTGTTAGATNYRDATCGGGNSPETMFYFTTCPDYRGGTLRASTCNTATLTRATWDTVLYARQGNSPTEFCNDNACGLQSLLPSSRLSPGSGVRAIYVDGAETGEGPFSMLVSLTSP